MGKIIIIAAVGKNLELGRDNNLIWRIKGDMKFFKDHTINHPILMGNNTFISLPKMLPQRLHIVLTNKTKDHFSNDVIVINSLKEFYDIKNKINDDIYVIGGASLYKQMIDNTDIMYLTEIEDECLDADAYFPKFKDEQWTKEVLEEHLNNNPPYRHVMYKKK